MTRGILGEVDLLSAIGPQRTSEPLLARRVRFHQSWYRVAVLGLLQFGCTAGPISRQLGSILSDDDAVGGWNFTSPSARRLYERRRSEGWGVDPVRCTKYLTSSQALTLNLLGPLEESRAWFAHVLSDVLQRSDIIAVERVWVEFAPPRRSDYLHDMTRIDALVLMRTSRGNEFLAIEVKYSDRFNSRRVDIDRPPYRDLAASVGLWRDPDNTLRAMEINQLARCHALTAAVSREMAGMPSAAGLLVLHHSEDAGSRAVVDRYRSHLSDPTLIRAVTLGDFITTLERSATSADQREAALALNVRYLAESKSESAWRMSGDRSITAGSGGRLRSKR